MFCSVFLLFSLFLISFSRPPRIAKYVFQEYRRLKESGNEASAQATLQYYHYLQEIYVPTGCTEYDCVKSVVFPKGGNCSSFETPKALFLGGGTGSGKTTIRFQAQEKYPVLTLNESSAVLDVDEIIFELDGFAQALEKDRCAISSSEFRNRAYSYWDQFFAISRAQKCDILLDSTMSSETKYSGYIDTLEKSGYKNNTYMLGVYLPTYIAANRSLSRAKAQDLKEDGKPRYVPLWVIVSSHSGYSSAFPTYFNRLGNNTFLYSNVDSPGIEVIVEGKVVNSNVYTTFLDKADETEQTVKQDLVDHNLGYVVTEYDKGFCAIVPTPTSGGVVNTVTKGMPLVLFLLFLNLSWFWICFF